MVSCYNAKTGEPYYHQTGCPRPNLQSSPVGANGRLLPGERERDVIVLKMGEAFEVLATNTMTHQLFIATPAIAGGDCSSAQDDSVLHPDRVEPVARPACANGRLHRIEPAPALLAGWRSRRSPRRRPRAQVRRSHALTRRPAVS